MWSSLLVSLLGILVQCAWAQELLAASHGFPALGELAGVVADEVRLHM